MKLPSAVLVAALAAAPIAAITPIAAWAQPAKPGAAAGPLDGLAPQPRPAAPGMPEIVTDCIGAEEFGGNRLERAGWCSYNSNRPDNEKLPEVRTLADRALKENPRSYRAHYLMGLAQHLGEANLPKALHHLERAEELFTEEHGTFMPHGDGSLGTWSVMLRIMRELVYVHGEMDHHEEKLAYVDRIRERTGIDYGPLKAWPLMKLKRWDEARLYALAALEGDSPESDYWRPIGLTALCAIESEMRNRQAAYDACQAAAAPVMNDDRQGGVALSNAAAAAVEMFRFDEAERLYLEATRREVEGTINPWGRLVHLYLRQGRFAEAVSALREMKRYRNARPAYFDQQDQTDAELTGASLLMIAGRMQDALRITRRTASRPDRQGTSSAQAEQNEAGNLIMHRVALLDMARRTEEEASYSTFGKAMELRARAIKLRYDAWIHGRKAGKILADRERLVTSLRPECPGSIEVPSWLDQEIVSLVGPGVALAALEEARAEETLPDELAGPTFSLFEAEARLLDGDEEEALEAAKAAVQGLLPSEALLRARAAAIGAEAARELGRTDEAIALLQLVLSSDPGLIRRLGHTLPVELVESSGSAAVKEARSLLEDSPLFEVSGWGLQLILGEGEVALALPDGTELVRARVPPGPKDDGEALARRIARAAHEELLIPSVDITQADIRSLDGGLGGGGRASERAKSILEDLVDE